MEVAKTRIYLESFDKKLINSTSKKIRDIFLEGDENIVGPISLPIKKRIYCVLRSPHVDKDSREHLEIRSYKHILDIYPTQEQKRKTRSINNNNVLTNSKNLFEISTNTKTNLLVLDIPAGVSISVSMILSNSKKQ